MSQAYGERLRQQRQYLGWSQAELASYAGVPVRTIENWEQGVHRNPTPRSVKLVAAALRVPWRWLLYGEEENEREHYRGDDHRSAAGREHRLVSRLD